MRIHGAWTVRKDFLVAVSNVDCMVKISLALLACSALLAAVVYYRFPKQMSCVRWHTWVRRDAKAATRRRRWEINTASGRQAHMPGRMPPCRATARTPMRRRVHSQRGSGTSMPALPWQTACPTPEERERAGIPDWKKASRANDARSGLQRLQVRKL